MEGRKLNFNAPLLSVRRYSATPVVSSDRENGKITGNLRPSRQYTIPFYRSELDLEQVTEPVTVPFLWEQIPGRPKDGDPEPQQPEEVSVTPRLPLRRTLDIVKYPLEKEFEDRPQTESCSLNNNVTRLDCFKLGNDEKGNSDLENDDDEYSDALEALSLTDSFSVNYSVSGLSGSDGEVVKQSGTFSTDPQTRDFMMRRFLPAAKAMALEPPQYASRKQPTVAIEQPRVVNKVVSEDRRPPLNQCIVLPHYDQDVDEEESEEEVDEYDKTSNISSKACGFLPRLCLNKSLCLLNPVPGLRVRTHSSMSNTSESEVRKPRKAACIESHNKTLKKSASDVVYKHQSDSGGRSPKLLGIENKKMICGSNRFAHSNEQQMTNSSSPFRRGVSPYRNERPQSPFRGGGFLGVPKETENLKANRFNLYGRAGSKSQELVPRQTLNKGSGSASPAVEKTLYIDTVKFAKKSFSNSSPSETKGQMDSVSKGFETSRRSRGTEENANAEFSLQDLKWKYIAEEESVLEPKIVGPVEARRSSFSGILHPRSQADAVECLRRPDTGLDQECKSLECIKVAADGNLNSRSEKSLQIVDPGYIDNGFEQSPLPPPLPKTPSESWLWRTLPSVSSRNPFSHSHAGTRINPKKQDAKLPLTDTKWETIVKTSYSHHDHSRYSEELTTHFSQQSKT
ncbi:hypothetical protein QYF36_016362 [Acer negundo]|nr:hypothetical protein QYF36_016362 [Acer negundo]